MDTLSGRKIWIIGASSGIGAALAAELSMRGARLVLSARRKYELDTLVASFPQPVEICPADVSDAKALKDIATKQGPFDSVIFLAAVYEPGLMEDMSLQSAEKTVDINIKGALNTVAAVYPAMKAARKGQIVLCGSVAGYCGLPNSQPYSLTKAAVMNLAQTLRVEARMHNVDVKLISPGFVRTPLTDKNDFDMPFIIEASAAARLIADGLTARAFEIHFPKRFTWIVKLLALMPYPVYFRIAATMLKKKIKGT